MRFTEGGILAFALAMCPAPVTPKHAGSFTVIGFGNPVVVGREDPIISPGTVSAQWVFHSYILIISPYASLL